MTASPSPRRDDLLARLFAPVDIAFLVFFRIYFGAMLLWELWDIYQRGLIASVYVAPTFHFTYHGFSWVQSWPGNGIYWHFAGLAVLSVFVMAGFLYRISALLLWLGFTYLFLLEKAVYLNHFYLIGLLCFLLNFLPAHRAWSIDARIWPALRSDVVPAWTLWLLRFQIALPYVFGGIAKLNADWLQGQPMQIWLSKSVWEVLLGPVAKEYWFAFAFSWGGLVLDLGMVPALLWRRSRTFAYCAAVVFHLMNAFMLNIGIFPWLMIGATTVFFDPDWPRRVITSSTPSPAMSAAIGGVRTPNTPSTRIQKALAAALLLYAVIHVIVPFRHWLYPGNVLWTEQGALFSWHMMLRDKVNLLRFVVIDSGTRKAEGVDLSHWLSDQQVESMGRDPEMLREFAEYLGRKYAEKGREVEVRVLGLCSLNGRRPQPIVNPTVDLSRQPRTLFHKPYLIPLREPLRRPVWDVPVKDWEMELMKKSGQEG